MEGLKKLTKNFRQDSSVLAEVRSRLLGTRVFSGLLHDIAIRDYIALNGRIENTWKRWAVG
jgi:hypothetical protein